MYGELQKFNCPSYFMHSAVDICFGMSVLILN